MQLQIHDQVSVTQWLLTYMYVHERVHVYIQVQCEDEVSVCMGLWWGKPLACCNQCPHMAQLQLQLSAFYYVCSGHHTMYTTDGNVV